MAKATIKLATGAVITIEGTTDEVQELLELYGKEESVREDAPPEVGIPHADIESDEPDLAQIVDFIKSCEEAEQIESQILDRTSEVNRVLLPLYIVHEYLENRFGLTTVEIGKITTDLGIRVFRQNAYRALTGTGAGYVQADRVRRRGVATKYKLNRRGLHYMKSVMCGSADDE